MFSQRLKELRKSIDITQVALAKKLFVSQQAVAKWEVGTASPNPDMLNNIASFFNVTTDYLLGRTDEKKERPREKGVRIPVLGCVQAGIPIEAIEDIIDYEEIPESMAKNGEYFALQVRGDSMEPKFSEGDVVIVRKQESADDGDIAVVLVNGNEATVKKIKRRMDGIMLIPNNPSYDPMFYSNKEIEELPVKIIGKVVELRAKF